MSGSRVRGGVQPSNRLPGKCEFTVTPRAIRIHSLEIPGSITSDYSLLAVTSGNPAVEFTAYWGPRTNNSLVREEIIHEL